MTIAYIILAHRLPAQLARLIDRLDDGDATFFVHLDQTARRGPGRDLREEFLRAVDKHPHVQLLPRYRCYWGSFQIVQATIAGIQAVVDSPARFDRVMLLSGQHYPIKPVAHIRRFLEQHREAEFIESFPLRQPNRWTRQRGAFRDLARILHWHFRIRSRWLHVPVKRRFLETLQPHGGSQWWSLSMPCVTHIHDFIRGNPRFVAYFRHCFIPDELFFQTIVSNSSFRERLVGSDLTYAKWNNPAPPYPAVLDRHCLDELLRSAALFARKFDTTQDPKILDLIDQRILAHAHTTGSASAAGASLRQSG